MLTEPIILKKWLEENESFLKPPVNNKEIFPGSYFIVQAVGGPNRRNDYHVNEGGELFYQIKGDIILRIRKNGKPFDIPIKEGEMYMLPPNVPHSPQRLEGSMGIVIEHTRREGEQDGFQWYCDNCQEKLYEVFVPLTDIVKQLPEIFDTFYGNKDLTTCRHCGTTHVKN